MNKDVIYIDVEDDVTAIIGKVKDAKEKVVALVPPKRTGALQSAVNLRILQRTAKNAGKRLVLITNDQSLIPLAAGAGLPIAKNLQTKPEVPEIAALQVDDDDDIIDGSLLPVGEHAATTDRTKQAAKHIPVTSAAAPEKKSYAKPPHGDASPRKSKVAGKVPNFSSFRKKLIFIILGVLLLVGFLVWAIFFAPHATVTITAKTSDERISTALTVGTGQTTNVDNATIKAVQVQTKEEASVEFAATGTEEQGERATGTMEITRTSIGTRSISIPVGTGFSSGDYTFTTTESATLGRTEVREGSLKQDTAEVAVRAVNIGEAYNLSARDYDSTVDGVEASGSAMSGGSKKTVKIVTQSDVQKASEQIAAKNSDEIKAALKEKFPSSVKSIDSSFRTGQAETAAAPEVGKEAPDGKATLTSSVTYLMDGISTSELEKYIEAAAKSRVSQESDQRVYESGVAEAQLADFAANEAGGTVNLTAVAQIGPEIKDDDIKNRVKTKRFGDIQEDLKSIQGVDDVDVKFFPFWVNTVPEDTSKITVKFNLDRASASDE